MKSVSILVVGAGFAGSVVARTLADTGRYVVTVIDKRDHIGGNTYDPVCPDSGQRYHKYGPHIFHTNSKEIFRFVSKFSEWFPYKHRVLAYVEGVGQVPLPINMETLNTIYGMNMNSPGEVKEFLSRICEPVNQPANAGEHLRSIYGRELTEIFFSRYTRKMWDISLDELPVSVVRRLPVRYDDNPCYFNDRYQCMPRHGYQQLFRNMLDHPAITVQTRQEFDTSMEGAYTHVFNSMPIDQYFDYRFGELPYRSIIFDHTLPLEFEPRAPSVNFTDQGRYTRVTKWRLFPGLGDAGINMTTHEIPCSYLENDMERYYPVKTVDGKPQRTYKQYREHSKRHARNMTFIGRCGQYIYYDMDQVIANSLALCNRFLCAHGN